MIRKIESVKNGYVIDDTTTPAEFMDIIQSYGSKFHCILCTRETADRIQHGLWADLYNRPKFVYRNGWREGLFYVNGYY